MEYNPESPLYEGVPAMQDSEGGWFFPYPDANGSFQKITANTRKVMPYFPDSYEFSGRPPISSWAYVAVGCALGRTLKEARKLFIQACWEGTQITFTPKLEFKAYKPWKIGRPFPCWEGTGFNLAEFEAICKEEYRRIFDLYRTNHD